jgi:hypothetical protein
MIEIIENVFNFACFIFNYINETNFFLPLDDVIKDD